MIFDYQRGVRAVPERLTPEIFNNLIEADWLAEVCKKVAATEDHDTRARLKRDLPAVIWQATFDGKPRKNEFAQPSGLYMLDVDHVDNAEVLALTVVRKAAEQPELGIMVVHITPSGKGLRVVAAMKAAQDFKTIPEYQAWLAKKLGLNEYDTCTKDFARLSYLVPKTYFRFLDPGIWTATPEVILDTQALQPLDLKRSEPKPEPPKRTQTMYKGKALSEIWTRLVERVHGKAIEEGERNAAIFKVVLLFRYICDNNVHVILQNIPNYGLTYQELKQTVENACKYSMTPKGYDDMKLHFKAMYATNAEGSDASAANADNDIPEGVVLTRPKLDFDLPPVFNEFVATAPEDFRVPMFISMLPVMGFLATGLRAKYIDNAVHTPSFFAMLSAPQASGKGFLRNMVNELTREIQIQDQAARALEAAYKEELKRSKNSKKQPENPRAKVRIVPASISVAQLLKRLDYADGQHLFTFCEEIDTLTKSNRSGAWSQKSDIYRNAFDNAVYGQDYISESSYSASLPVFYNLLVLGTPRATERFFKDPEDGLVSRVMFISLPDQFGAKMPIFKEIPPRRLEYVRAKVSQLSQMNCTLDMSFLYEEIEKWLDEKRNIAATYMSEGVNIFMRRCAVMGFRAAMIVTACYKKVTAKQLETIRNVFNFVADYTLFELVTRFEIVIQAKEQTEKYSQRSVLVGLPKEFDRASFVSACSRSGYKTSPRMILYRLIKAGLVVKIKADRYRKVTLT